jgi:asparagine synthase (glutamine-hydrolysing)
MCGILGVVDSRPGRLASDEVMLAAAETLQHRGPDDYGCHRDARAVLIHRRLSIIDLNTGHQPVPYQGRRYWCVFNGEIYNYLELREELREQGYGFETESDTEVILAAFAAWGERSFGRLRGMFAFALWDAQTGELWLARDPLGKKPLFYTVQDGQLAFASELKALESLPGFAFDFDEDAFCDYMLMGYVPTPRSIYRQVHKLEAGHYLAFSAQGLRRVRFWDFGMTPKHREDETELLHALDELLSEAVRIRLRSDVDFGAFLSGGLDSSIVATLMAREMSRPVRTFSIGFEEADYDELEDARRVARHIGADHEELVVRAENADLLERLAWHLDEPFADSSALPTYLVSQMAARRVKMVLSGDGGDEVFGGYTRYRKYLTVDRLHRVGGRAGAWGIGAAGRLLRQPRVAWLGERLAHSFPARYLTGVSLNTPAGVARLLDRQVQSFGSVEKAFVAGRGSSLDSIIEGDIRTYLLDDVLVKVDRMAMAHGLEVRSPLLDQELVRWAVRLPDDLKIRNGAGKHLLTRFAAGRLPPENLRKRKQGFAIPMAEWLRTGLRDRLGDAIRSRALRDTALFSQPEVERLFVEHCAGTADHREPLWQLLMFSLWLDRPSLPRASELPQAG